MYSAIEQIVLPICPYSVEECSRVLPQIVWEYKLPPITNHTFFLKVAILLERNVSDPPRKTIICQAAIELSKSLRGSVIWAN